MKPVKVFIFAVKVFSSVGLLVKYYVLLLNKYIVIKHKIHTLFYSPLYTIIYTVLYDNIHRNKRTDVALYGWTVKQNIKICRQSNLMCSLKNCTDLSVA